MKPQSEETLVNPESDEEPGAAAIDIIMDSPVSRFLPHTVDQNF